MGDIMAMPQGWSSPCGQHMRTITVADCHGLVITHNFARKGIRHWALPCYTQRRVLAACNTAPPLTKVAVCHVCPVLALVSPGAPGVAAWQLAQLVNDTMQAFFFSLLR